MRTRALPTPHRPCYDEDVMPTVKKPRVPTDELIQAIRQASVKEELAIPLYDSHISAALFWSGLPEEVQQRIIAGLTVLTTESRGHVKILKQIEKIVRDEAHAHTHV